MKIGSGARNIYEMTENAYKRLGHLLPALYEEYPELDPANQPDLKVEAPTTDSPKTDSKNAVEEAKE